MRARKKATRKKNHRKEINVLQQSGTSLALREGDFQSSKYSTKNNKRQRKIELKPARGQRQKKQMRDEMRKGEMFYERLPKQSSPYLFIMIRWFFCAFLLFRYVLLYFCYFLRSTFLCFLFSFGCTDIITTSREMFMRGSCANFSQNNIFWSCGCFCWSLFFRCGCVFFFLEFIFTVIFASVKWNFRIVFFARIVCWTG